MVTKKIIDEIYRKYKNPPSNIEELNINYYIKMLKEYHPMSITSDRIIIENAGEFCPFKHILISRLTGIIEFSKYVAFILPEHIFFFDRHSENIRLHMKKEPKPGFFSQLLSKICKGKKESSRLENKNFLTYFHFLSSHTGVILTNTIQILHIISQITKKLCDLADYSIFFGDPQCTEIVRNLPKTNYCYPVKFFLILKSGVVSSFGFQHFYWI